jgi:hypothetical protein
MPRNLPDLYNEVQEALQFFDMRRCAMAAATASS